MHTVLHTADQGDSIEESSKQTETDSNASNAYGVHDASSSDSDDDNDHQKEPTCKVHMRGR